MPELLLPDMKAIVPGCLQSPTATCQVVLVSKLLGLKQSILNYIVCSTLHVLPARHYFAANPVPTEFHGLEQ